MNIDFNRRLSIAPMLDCTDRHERYFLRLLSKHILLYSEMVVSTGLLHCENKDLFLGHEPFEHPAVLPAIQQILPPHRNLWKPQALAKST